MTVTATSDAPGSATTAHRPDLQVLRAVAVLLVVVFHAWPRQLPGGYVGVDVFFVVSGYLITAKLLAELEATGRVDFGAFYAARIRRLLPAAALVIVVTVLAFALTHSLIDARERVAGGIAAALYVGNLWQAWRSVDYLSQEESGADPLLHLWSLGVEEQFYLIWPVLLLLAWRWAARRRVRRQAFGSVIAGVVVASLAISVLLTAWSASWAFFGLPSRVWEFGIGALAVLLRPQAVATSLRRRRVAVLLGLAAMVTAALCFTTRMAFPGAVALLPVAGAFLWIVAGGADLRLLAGDGFPVRALVWLGDRSYALYLWHWPVLIATAALWPVAVSVTFAAPVAIGVSVWLAGVTTRWVENPIRHHVRFRRPAAAAVLGTVLMASMLAIVVGSPWIAPAGQDVAARRAAEVAIRDRPRLYDDRCFAPVLTIEPPSCVYGDPSAARTLVLLGDSHAAQWFPALEAWARSHRLRLVVFVKAACPVAEIEPFDPKLGRAYTECTAWREQVFEQLARLRPDAVIASQASSYQAFVSRDTEAMAQWRSAMGRSLDRLQALSPDVVLIRDTPLPVLHVPRCLAREAAARSVDPGACRFSRDSAASTLAFETERAAAADRAKVSVVDLNAEICPEASCSARQRGLVLFHDTQHLSARAAERLSAALWERLPASLRASLQAP